MPPTLITVTAMLIAAGIAVAVGLTLVAVYHHGRRL